MNRFYIKTAARGTSEQLANIDGLLQFATKDLNTVYLGLKLIDELKGIAFKTNSLIDEIIAIETHSKLISFFKICILDITVVYKNALSSTHLWEEMHCLRQGYLLIYEAVKTYGSHSRYIKELAFRTSDSAVKMFDEMSAQLRKFKKDYDYEGTISQIRNSTVAHIEKDPLHFFKSLGKFDRDKAFKSIEDFVSILRNLLLLSDYIYANGIREIIAKYSRSFQPNEYLTQIDELLKDIEYMNNEDYYIFLPN